MWITITQPLLLKFPFLSRFPTSEGCLTAEKTPGPWFFSWPKIPKSSPRGVDPFLERNSHSSTMGSTKKTETYILSSILTPGVLIRGLLITNCNFQFLLGCFFEICWSFLNCLELFSKFFWDFLELFWSCLDFLELYWIFRNVWVAVKMCWRVALYEYPYPYRRSDRLCHSHTSTMGSTENAEIHISKWFKNLEVLWVEL